MKYILYPLLLLGFLILLPYLGRTSSKGEQEYLWMTVYTYDLPAGTLAPGSHSYEYSFKFLSPRPGELTGKPHTFELDPSANGYRGYALVRPNGLQAQVDVPDGTECKQVESVNTSQALRFMVVWVPDERLTADQMKDHLASMEARLRIDGEEWVPLQEQRTTISWEALWNCQPWIKRQDSSAFLFSVEG